MVHRLRGLGDEDDPLDRGREGRCLDISDEATVADLPVGNYGIRTHRYKLIYYYGKALGSAGAVDRDTPPEWEFYDLEKDPREMRNAYSDPAYAKVIAGLKVRLAKLQAHYKDTPA